MLTEKELERAVKVLIDRLHDVNILYIRKVAEAIKKVGQLNSTNMNRLVIMAEMGTDIAEINQALQNATALNVRDLMQIYQAALQSVYYDPRFAQFLPPASAPVLPPTQTPRLPTVNPPIFTPGAGIGGTQGPPTLSQMGLGRLNRMAQNVAMQTAQSMVNLSNTTIVSTTYRDAVDQAILAVNSGVDDYKSATRNIIQNIGYNGMQVQYPSGYRRRLDTAVRQNVINGANQINKQGSIIMGEELGFNAYELSAHLMSAPDHEPVQGHVFLKDQFERMQSGLDCYDVDGHHYAGFRRPIAEWNCMHFPAPFDTRYSTRRYTDAQLTEWAKSNKAGCKIGKKKYTLYKASQMMRKLETAIRWQKDAAVAAQAADDMELRKKCQKKINAYVAQYDAIAAAAGIRPRRDRMVVNGFKAVKV